jgi:calcium-dependent protein kinase
MPKTGYITVSSYLYGKAKIQNINNKESKIIKTGKIFCNSNINDFNFLKNIGRGAYGNIFLVELKKTKDLYVIKSIRKDQIISENILKNIKNEKDILKQANNEFILNLSFFFQTNERIYFVTPFIKGGDLYELLKKKKFLDEETVKFYCVQIAIALQCLHDFGYIYRDLKPENILIKKDEDGFYRVKVCDFGTSKAFKIGDTEKQLVGSAYYIAPEVIQKKYNSKCDLWSCGVIMFVLLTKKPPFGGRTDAIIMQNIQVGKYKEELLNNYSPFAKELVGLLLEKNIKKRINAEQALNHPWFDVYKCKDILTDIQDKDTIKRFIENLKNYKRGSIIQETALAYLVHNYPDLDEIVNACKLFGQIDTNGKGKITLNDFIEGLNKILKKNMEEDAKKIFENLVEFESGYLEYEMFIRAAINKKIFLTEDALKFTFKFFDKENKNKITSESILKIFEDSIKKDENVKVELEKIIKEVNANNNSEDLHMDFKNFSEFMKNILK